MNNISDKYILIIMLITIIFVFGLAFSVNSPERKIIDSPIMWKEEYTNIKIIDEVQYNHNYLRFV